MEGREEPGDLALDAMAAALDRDQLRRALGQIPVEPIARSSSSASTTTSTFRRSAPCSAARARRWPCGSTGRCGPCGWPLPGSRPMSPENVAEIEQLEALAGELADACRVARTTLAHRERPEPTFAGFAPDRATWRFPATVAVGCESATTPVADLARPLDSRDPAVARRRSTRRSPTERRLRTVRSRSITARRSVDLGRGTRRGHAPLGGRLAIPAPTSPRRGSRSGYRTKPDGRHALVKPCGGAFRPGRCRHGGSQSDWPRRWRSPRCCTAAAFTQARAHGGRPAVEATLVRGGASAT